MTESHDEKFRRLLREGSDLSYTNGFMAAVLRFGQLALEHPIASHGQLVKILMSEAEQQPGHYNNKRPK